MEKAEKKKNGWVAWSEDDFYHFHLIYEPQTTSRNCDFEL